MDDVLRQLNILPGNASNDPFQFIRSLGGVPPQYGPPGPNDMPMPDLSVTPSLYTTSEETIPAMPSEFNKTYPLAQGLVSQPTLPEHKSWWDKNKGNVLLGVIGALAAATGHADEVAGSYLQGRQQYQKEQTEELNRKLAEDENKRQQMLVEKQIQHLTETTNLTRAQAQQIVQEMPQIIQEHTLRNQALEMNNQIMSGTLQNQIANSNYDTLEKYNSALASQYLPAEARYKLWEDLQNIKAGDIKIHDARTAAAMNDLELKLKSDPQVFATALNNMRTDPSWQQKTATEQANELQKLSVQFGYQKQLSTQELASREKIAGEENKNKLDIANIESFTRTLTASGMRMKATTIADLDRSIKDLNSQYLDPTFSKIGREKPKKGYEDNWNQFGKPLRDKLMSAREKAIAGMPVGDALASEGIPAQSVSSSIDATGTAQPSASPATPGTGQPASHPSIDASAAFQQFKTAIPDRAKAGKPWTEIEAAARKVGMSNSQITELQTLYYSNIPPVGSYTANDIIKMSKSGRAWKSVEHDLMMKADANWPQIEMMKSVYDSVPKKKK